MIRRVTSVEIMESFMVKTTAIHVILVDPTQGFRTSAFYKIDSKQHSD